MKKFTALLVLSALFHNIYTAQADFTYGELLNVCDSENIIVFGDKQPKPKEGIHKIEHHLNRDLEFLVNNPDFVGTVFIENTVSCDGKVDNFNVIVSCDNYQLESELIKHLSKIEKWNVGEHHGKPADFWYLWKFKVKKGKITIKDKKKFYR